MARKVNNITELVGDTPIVGLHKMVAQPSATLWGKLEGYNPVGSVKDRIGLSMIDDAERRGVLRPGDTIVEPTSGNTGIGLAFIAAQRGYRLILVMPEIMSQDKMAMLRAFGAEIEIVGTGDTIGMDIANEKARELAEEHGYFFPGQFTNPANPYIHETTTGPEIVEAFADTGLDYFVSGIGTGGTITGAGKHLREHFSDIRIYAVEPEKSAVLSGGEPGMHGIEGIGAGFVPEVLNTDIYDEVIRVSDENATLTTRRLAKEEGLLLGRSSGAITWAGLQVASGKREDQHLLVMLPDTGQRYLSSDLFEDRSSERAIEYEI